MRLYLAAALALPLALPAAAAAAPSAAEIASFIAAMEAVGCIVADDAQAASVEAATGFDDDTLAEIVAVLLSDGRVVIPETMEGLRLTTAACR